MTSSIFKAYDIRGLSPQELDAAAAGRIGTAIGALMKPKTVMIGHDMRGTSLMLEGALIEGLRSQGVNVVQIGMCSTPMFNFAVASAQGAYDIGIMITASHNPKEYNGMKLALPDNMPIALGSGLEKIRDLALSDQPLFISSGHGEISQDTTVLDRYCDAIWTAADLEGDFSGWHIAIDCGNGMNGITMPKFKSKLTGADVYPLYWDTDGNFPNHEANPMKPETLADLAELLVRRECQFGAAYDGDGDRAGFVDETGATIRGDIMTAILAREILIDKPGATILYDGRSSRIVKETIEQAGGVAMMMDKLGHSNIKRQMKMNRAAFAGELSMHYYFDFLNNCESSDLVFLMILKMLRRDGKKLSEVWKPLMKYFHTGEINFTVANQQETMDHVEQAFAGQATAIIKTDGLHMDFGDWWLSLRSSNTEPYLRLNLEAETEQAMRQHLEEIKKLVG